MERQSFTAKSDASVSAAESGMFEGLEFPVEPGFVSQLPAGDLLAVYQASEEMLSQALALREQDERKRERNFPEFIL